VDTPSWPEHIRVSFRTPIAYNRRIILGGGFGMRVIVASLLALVLLGALTAFGTGRLDAQQASCNPAVEAC
jgi:hypothetical protein